MNHSVWFALPSSSIVLLWISLITIITINSREGPSGVVVHGFQRVTSLQPRHYNHLHHRQQSYIVFNHPKKMNIVSFSAIPKDDTSVAIPIIPPNTKINGENSTSTVIVTTTDISMKPTTTPTPPTTTTMTTKPIELGVPFWIVLWRFTRPHTLIGSALAIPSLHLLAAPTVSSIFTITHLYSILYATIPALLMNLYITGLNQITDVDIDKINKPNLPIAAGILKKRDAIITCMVALIVSLYMGMYGPARYSTPGLQVALWGSGILGTLYSVEPFRLKRYPVFAALCIVAVRGAIINASFFAHAMAAAFHVPSATVLSCLKNDPRCLFSSIFFGIFGIVIALMKDVPDVLGDKSSNVRTFSVRIGPERIFHLSRKLLMGLFYVCTAGFVQRAITSTTSALAICRYMIAIACLVAARSVRQQSKTVDPTNPSQVYEYYMHLWKIFYMSYLMLPFAR